MESISITHLARNLADVVNRVLYRGERFTVLRGNRPVVELVPPPSARRLGDLPAILSGLPRLDPADAEGFGVDVQRARDELPPARDPWDS
jgi:antitoxin (DNA-binding transcriptional repressor) of toxin-antitoxin stability system